MSEPDQIRRLSGPCGRALQQALFRIRDDAGLLERVQHLGRATDELSMVLGPGSAVAGFDREKVSQGDAETDHPVAHARINSADRHRRGSVGQRDRIRAIHRSIAITVRVERISAKPRFGCVTPSVVVINSLGTVVLVVRNGLAV